MRELAPICLFAYNRLSEMQQTVAALQKNFLAKESDLFVFSDGAKNEDGTVKVNEVRTFIKGVTGFKSVTIFEAEENKGLANSIISGVSQIIEQFGKVIVLEDDLVTTPNFLDFMNQSLNYYSLNVRVKSINGFSLDVGENTRNSDVYFHMRTYSWGWATWKNRWEASIFDKKLIKSLISNEVLKRFEQKCGNNMSRMLKYSLTNKNNSWYALWAFSHFLENRMATYPYLSKVQNIGYGENATHCTNINVLKSNYDIYNLRDFKFTNHLNNSKYLTDEFLKYFTFKHKLLYRLRLLFKKEGLKMLMLELKEKLKYI